MSGAWANPALTKQCLWIDVENRDYHYLSQSEIGGAKRISQQLCSTASFPFTDFSAALKHRKGLGESEH